MSRKMACNQISATYGEEKCKGKERIIRKQEGGSGVGVREGFFYFYFCLSRLLGLGLEAFFTCVNHDLT